ncbi:MAG: hypothetical protein K6B38_08170 [Ruminococcus sp.]|nr:hypothetical protein [Ruminococcus sp.]
MIVNVPKEENYHNELYYYSIFNPTELTGLKNAKVNRINSYNVLVADLYTQDTIKRMNVLPDDQQINASNNKIFVEASTSITINNANAKSHLNQVSLYHSFDLTLNRYTEAGVFNDIIGIGDSEDTNRINATYKERKKDIKEIFKERENVKKSYGRNGRVWLTDEEYQGLVDDYGKDTAHKFIERMDLWIRVKKAVIEDCESELRLWLERENVPKLDPDIEKYKCLINRF